MKLDVIIRIAETAVLGQHVYLVFLPLKKHSISRRDDGNVTYAMYWCLTEKSEEYKRMETYL